MGLGPHCAANQCRARAVGSSLAPRRRISVVYCVRGWPSIEVCEVALDIYGAQQSNCRACDVIRTRHFHHIAHRWCDQQNCTNIARHRLTISRSVGGDALCTFTLLFLRLCGVMRICSEDRMLCRASSPVYRMPSCPGELLHPMGATWSWNVT